MDFDSNQNTSETEAPLFGSKAAPKENRAKATAAFLDSVPEGPVIGSPVPSGSGFPKSFLAAGDGTLDGASGLGPIFGKKISTSGDTTRKPSRPSNFSLASATAATEAITTTAAAPSKTAGSLFSSPRRSTLTGSPSRQRSGSPLLAGFSLGKRPATTTAATPTPPSSSSSSFFTEPSPLNEKSKMAGGEQQQQAPAAKRMRTETQTTPSAAQSRGVPLPMTTNGSSGLNARSTTKLNAPPTVAKPTSKPLQPPAARPTPATPPPSSRAIGGGDGARNKPSLTPAAAKPTLPPASGPTPPKALLSSVPVEKEKPAIAAPQQAPTAPNATSSKTLPSTTTSSALRVTAPHLSGGGHSDPKVALVSSGVRSASGSSASPSSESATFAPDPAIEAEVAGTLDTATFEAAFAQSQALGFDLSKTCEKVSSSLSNTSDALKELTLKLYMQQHTLLMLQSPAMREGLDQLKAKYAHLFSEANDQ